MSKEMQNLLQGSIKEFQDKVANCTAIPCIYLPAANGLAYLIKNTAIQKEISAAIHLSTDQEQREDGLYDTGYVSVNTQDDIFAQFEEEPNVIIIDYKGFTLGINKSGEFTEEAKTFHYVGEILLTRNSQYIILDEDEAATLILSDSTTLWLDLSTALGFPIYPSFISPVNLNTAYITVTVNNSKPMGPVIQEQALEFQQYKKDDIRLHFINGTLAQAQKLSRDIFEAPSRYKTFGINNFVGWQQINDYTQRSFGIKQNIRVMDLTINYQLVSTTSEVLKYFKQISITVNGSDIETVVI